MAGAAVASFAQAPLAVPVLLILDSRAKPAPERLQRFTAEIWPEAVRNFSAGGIQLQVRNGKGEMGRAASSRPVFKGLEHGVINVVVTDYIPLEWDKARGLAGVTTQYDGYHLCLIALQHAHGNKFPYLSLNTCVHELLHVLMLDIFELRPKGTPGEQREWRIDRAATHLWLFNEAKEIRRLAAEYSRRLQALPRPL